MLDARRGTLVDPEAVSHMRHGIPMCGQQCADRYDRAQQQRDVVAQFHRTRVGGQYVGRSV
jgi:hypothetical protein